MIEVWYIEKGNAAGMFAQSVNSNGSDLPPASLGLSPPSITYGSRRVILIYAETTKLQSLARLFFLNLL